MAIKDFRVKDGLIVESGDITLSNGNINFSNGYMQTDNIKIDGNTVSSTNTDGNINLTPNGTGYVMIDGIRWPNGGDSNGKFLQVNGSGHLSWVTVATDVSGDTSPQLGGDLDVNGQKIKSVSDGNVVIELNGAGQLQVTDTDNSNAKIIMGGGQLISFDMETEGGASDPGTTVLSYKDSGGTGRAFVSVAQDVVRFENRTSNGKLQFYANTSTAGTSGTTKVLEIEDTLVKAYKQLNMYGNIVLDNDRQIRFFEADSNGSNYGAIKFPSSIGSNFTLTFPGNDGSSGQVLTTDGNGVLSWTAKTTNTNTTYSTSVVDSSGIKLRLTAGGSGSGTDDVKFVGSGATSVARTDASTITISSTDTNTTYSEATSSSAGLMSIAHHDKLDGIESGATADQSNAEIRTAVEAASDSNVFTDADHSKLNSIAANANNYSISSDLLDEDDMNSNSATKAASQQSIKAYVNTQVSGLVASAPAALDTLNELAAAINDDASFSTTMSDALGNRLRIDVSNQSLSGTQKTNALTNLGITATPTEINILDDGLAASDIPNLATSKITSGTFADARISESSVTQHQAALSITESQISDLGSYITAPRTVTAGGNTLASGETLAFTAGSNVTITESGGAVTIASAAGGLSDIVSDTTPQLGGDLDTNGNKITFADSVNAEFGDNGDLKIFHNGGHSIIRETGTGSLYLQSDDNVILSTDSSTKKMIKGVGGGEVVLYHNDVQKLNTSTSGVTVVDELHTEGATPHLTLKRTDNANVPTVRFKGSGGVIGASIDFDGTAGTSNELAFQVYDGASIAERFRVTYTGISVPYTGNIDSHEIVTSSGNTDIKINPHGTGDIILKTDGSNGQLGIGTVAAPDTAVHVKSTASIITLQRTDDSKKPGISFQNSNGNTRGAIKIDGTGGISNEIFMETYDGSTQAERLRVGHTVTTSNNVLRLEKGVHEKFATLTGATGTVAHDCSTGQIFYHTGAAANFTANFTNLTIAQEDATNIAIVINQGGTGYIPNAVQIGGSAQTIIWQGNSAPTATDNGTDTFSFTILNDGGTYVVLGQMVSFGGV